MQIDEPDVKCEDCGKPLYSVSFDKYENIRCAKCIVAAKEREAKADRRYALATMAQRDPMLAASTIMLLEDAIKDLKAQIATHCEELEALTGSK